VGGLGGARGGPLVFGLAARFRAFRAGICDCPHPDGGFRMGAGPVWHGPLTVAGDRRRAHPRRQG
jgi:hypothetical protein